MHRQWWMGRETYTRESRKANPYDIYPNLLSLMRVFEVATNQVLFSSLVSASTHKSQVNFEPEYLWCQLHGSMPNY